MIVQLKDNPDRQYLQIIDPWTGLPIPCDKVDTCEMRVYQSFTNRQRNFYVKVRDDAPVEIKDKYKPFANPNI